MVVAIQALVDLRQQVQLLIAAVAVVVDGRQETFQVPVVLAS
jgi:hypothetical protein